MFIICIAYIYMYRWIYVYDRFNVYYQRNFPMVLEATITIEWNGWRLSLSLMVYGGFDQAVRWFLMVIHHRSDDAMVTYHCSSLP